MNCSACGAQMPEISSFCPGCGRSVNVEPSARADRADALLAAFSYVLMVPAAVFLLLPSFKSKNFVRFHSWQSVLFTTASIVLGLLLRLVFAIFSMLPFVGFLIAGLCAGIGVMGVLILWIVLVVKAAQGRQFELPVIGPLAARLAS